MTGYLFADHLDPASGFELVASTPLLYEAGCIAVGVDPFIRACNDCRFTQPALVALLLARWTNTDDGLPSTILVGEGAGEIAALAAAGSLPWHDAVWLAAVRGRLMSRVVAEAGLASLALPGTTVRVARELALSHDLTIARDCAPEEVALTGRSSLIEVARRSARKLGITSSSLPRQRVLPGPGFAAVQQHWRAALHAIDLQPPRRPVMSCTTVSPIINPRASLVEGLTSAIRARQSRAALQRVGVRQLSAIQAPVTAP
jgi:acyl transferase domain-containing protein